MRFDSVFLGEHMGVNSDGFRGINDQNVFIFLQFSGKIGQMVGWRPLLVVGAPLGNPGSANGDELLCWYGNLNYPGLHILIFCLIKCAKFITYF